MKHIPVVLGFALVLGARVVLAQVTPDSTAGPPTAPMAAVAIPASEPGHSSPGLLGGGAAAGGWRAMQTALGARGVTASATLTGLWIGDVAGGVKTGGTAQSLAYGALDVDLDKLTGGWKGGHAFANFAAIRGRDLSARFVGDALVASNLEAYPSVRLYDAWFEQVFAGDRASLRVGAMGADEEFAGTEGGAMLTNSGFGWEAGIGANVVNGGPIYFVPALGARLEFRPGPRWTLRAGAYDGDSFDSPDGDPLVNAHGLHFSISRAQGAFLIGEGGHEWGTREGALAGSAKLGAWRHTADFPDLRLDAMGTPFTVSGLDPAAHHGNEGGYGAIEQKLWKAHANADAGIGGWVRVAGAPANRSLYSWVYEGGMRWTGVFPGRGRDSFAVGWVDAIVSPVLREHVRDANVADGGNRPIPDHEGALELAYQLGFGDHWVVTPGVQWVQHPGTTAATPNATVAGLRVTWQ